LRKVAIVGYSASREDAPFGDPTFELWGMNNLHAELDAKHFSRWFDIHKRDYIELNNANLATDHIAWLRTTTIPVYMIREFDEFPTSRAFPLQEIQEVMLKEWGFPEGETNYFHSALAYMVALALYEGVDEIHIFGIDMVMDSEWGFQRPNCEGWIALARQQVAVSDPSKKVRVMVAKRCALMKGPGLYGYESDNYAFPMVFERALIKQRETMEKQREEAREELAAANRKFSTIDGFLQNNQYWLSWVDKLKRGAQA
jgi:hypothetical protein